LLLGVRYFLFFNEILNPSASDVLTSAFIFRLQITLVFKRIISNF